MARKVRELRTDRKWSQAQLARELELSQSRLSELESGDGSFTAEQLLRILSLFNVPVTVFAPPRADLDLQNALARHGAANLQESSDVLPSERLDEVASAIHEALLAPEPRWLAAIAAVLVNSDERLQLLSKLRTGLADVGLQRRLGWVIDNTLAAIEKELQSSPPPPPRWARKYRRSEVVLRPWSAALARDIVPEQGIALLDPLDADIHTAKTAQEVEASRTDISRRWGILSALRPQDFAEALRGARGGR